MAEYWTVIYKALADFGDVISEAAKAKAAIEALGTSVTAEVNIETQGLAKALAARKALTDAAKADAGAMDVLARSAERSNIQTLYGGRSSMEQHLSDLQRELTYKGLLNRADWLGFTTPQQAYSWRQNEYNQRLLMNRAEWGGYATADQYIAYLQRETAGQSGLNAELLRRAQAYKSAAESALDYYDSLKGTHDTIGILSDQADQASALNDALNALPDEVSVKADFDDADAQAGIALFLAEIVDLSQTRATVEADLDTDVFARQMEVFEAALRRWRDRVEVTPVLGLGGGGRSGGGGGGPPPVVTAPGGEEKPNPADAAAWAALARAEADAGDKAGSSYEELMRMAAGADNAGDAAKYAYAASVALGRSADNAGAAAGRAGRAWGRWGGILGGTVTLFGGAATIGALHLVIDLLIEIAAVAVPAVGAALAGLGAYMAASFSSYMQVYKHFYAQFTATAATAQDLSPFAVNKKGQHVPQSTTTSLDFVAAKVQPDVMQQLGMVLTLMQGQSNLISQLATSTGGVLDRFAAKVVYTFEHGQGALHNFLSAGQRDLTGFGQIASSLGSLFMNFVKASEITHVAEDLLAVLAAVTRVAAAAANLVGPWGLAIAIGSHAAFVYGGLLVTGLKAAAAGVLALTSHIGPLADKTASVGRAIGLTGTSMDKLVSRSGAVKDAYEAFGKDAGYTAEQFASLVTQQGLAGKSAEEIARSLPNAESNVAKLGAAAEASAGQVGFLKKAWTSFMTVGLPFFIVGIALALGAYVNHVDDASNATTRLEASVSKLVNGSSLNSLQQNLGTGVLQLGHQIGVLQQQLDRAASGAGSYGLALDQLGHTDPALAGINRVSQALSHLSIARSVAGWLNSLANGAARVGGMATIIEPAAHALSALLGGGGPSNATLDQLNSLEKQTEQYGNEAVAVGSHVRQLGGLFGGDLTKGMGAATLAGLTVSQMMTTNSRTWGEALLQVRSMIMGYEQFGQKAGTLGQDVDAITYAQSNQLKEMGQLNQAWDTWTANVAAPRTTFIGFAEDLITFGQDAAKAGASMTGLGHGVAGLSKTVSDNALVLQQDFQNAYTQANQMLDALRTSGAPASVFTKTVKDLIQVLIPLAGHSKAAQAEVSALAQEANGPASGGIKALADWAGKSKDPLKAMQDATDSVVIATANLGTDAKIATGDLQTYVDKGLSGAAAALFNVSGKTKTYVDDLKKYGAQSPITQQAQEALSGAISSANHLAQQGANAMDNYTTANQRNQAALNGAEGARAQIIQDLQNAGKWSTNAKSNLSLYTIAIDENKLRTDGGKAARQNLINDLKNAGVNAQTARRLVDEYSTSLSKIPKNERTQVNVTGSGHWSVTPSTGHSNPTNNPPLTHRATGGFISQGAGAQGADSVPAMLMPGEFVVKTSAVQQYGVPMLSAINSQQFADGGVVGTLTSSSPPETGKWALAEYQKTVTSIEQAVADAIKNSMTSGFGPGGLGKASLRQIENWWMGAGGPGGIVAHIAAAITGAESGFNPKIVQAGQPYATTGWGLWQITPGNSEPQVGIDNQLLNGPSNARAAVAKFRGAGDSFSPWTTYVDGAYLRFMAEGGLVPGMAAGGQVVKDIEAATTKEQVREAMTLGSWLESRWNNKSQTRNTSGAFHINLGSHTGVSKAHADDPAYAVKWALPYYERAASSLGETYWKKQPEIASRLAALEAQERITGYWDNPGGGTMAAGWSATLKALGLNEKGQPVGQKNPTPKQQQAYSKAMKALKTSYGEEDAAEYALYTAAHKRLKKKHPGEYKHLMTDLTAIRKLQLAVRQDYHAVAVGGGSIHPSTWTELESAATSLARYQNQYASFMDHFAGSEVSKAQRELGLKRGLRHEIPIAEKAWAALYNKSAWSGAGPTPGPRRTLPVPGTPAIDLSPLIVGGPAAPVFGSVGSPSATGSGFAAGGVVGGDGASMDAVASMFALGGLVGGTPGLNLPGMDVALQRQLQAASMGQNPRTLGDAAASRVGVQVGNLTINNPVAERPSDSITRSSNRLAFLAGRGPV